MKKILAYRLQLFLIIFSVIFLICFLSSILLLTFGIYQITIWVLVTLLGITFPFWLYLDARIFFRPEKFKEDINLIQYGEEVAKQTRRNNRQLLVLGVACLFIIILGSIGHMYNILFFKWVFKILFPINIGLILIPWFVLHMYWYRYFYTAHKLGIEYIRAEIYFKITKAQEERQVHNILANKTYENYCAIVKGICTKSIFFNGLRSSFFAYPFEKSERRMLALKRELKKYGYFITMPIDNNLAEVLVCKLCKAILSAQYLVCEASIPNRNVYFEYGLAKGFNKTAWLLAFGNTNKNKTLSHPLFSDTIQIRKTFFNSKYVASKIERDVLSKLAEESVLSEKRMIPSQLLEIQNNDLKIATLISPLMFQAVSAIIDSEYLKMEELISRHMKINGLKTIKRIPPKSSHKVSNVLDLVQDTKVVVGILANDKLNAHEDINSLICYLIGFALAKGKNIILFQYLPCEKKMLDMAGMIHEINHSKDMDKILSDILEEFLIQKKIKYFTPLD